MVGVLMIMVILLAVLALVVVKALADSPWGTFTVFATIPIAMFMGLYVRFIRPGRIGEMSVIGFVLLMLRWSSAGPSRRARRWRRWFTSAATTLALLLIAYGFVASVLPVWLLLAPRDYLSTFLKIGTIVGARDRHPVSSCPSCRCRPSPSSSTAPARCSSGSLFPFLFITIACGAVSGFHALIASGTTPKMLENESAVPLHRLWRHADGVLRRDHGADRAPACSSPASISR